MIGCPERNGTQKIVRELNYLYPTSEQPTLLFASPDCKPSETGSGNCFEASRLTTPTAMQSAVEAVRRELDVTIIAPISPPPRDYHDLSRFRNVAFAASLAPHFSQRRRTTSGGSCSVGEPFIFFVVLGRNVAHECQEGHGQRRFAKRL